ncbi:MAG: hypothetical protein R2939_08220 [Kofleriaceae bacterium]
MVDEPPVDPGLLAPLEQLAAQPRSGPTPTPTSPVASSTWSTC